MGGQVGYCLAKADVQVRILPPHTVSGGVVQRQHSTSTGTERQVELLAASTFFVLKH